VRQYEVLVRFYECVGFHLSQPEVSSEVRRFMSILSESRFNASFGEDSIKGTSSRLIFFEAKNKVHDSS
jgi:hypothetical protein